MDWEGPVRRWGLWYIRNWIYMFTSEKDFWDFHDYIRSFLLTDGVREISKLNTYYFDYHAK